MIPLYHDPYFTLRFADDCIISRIHLESEKAGRRLAIFGGVLTWRRWVAVGWSDAPSYGQIASRVPSSRLTAVLPHTSVRFCPASPDGLL